MACGHAEFTRSPLRQFNKEPPMTTAKQGHATTLPIYYSRPKAAAPRLSTAFESMGSMVLAYPRLALGAPRFEKPLI